jgi:hypothetical protein
VNDAALHPDRRARARNLRGDLVDQLVIDLADAVPLDKTVVQIDSRALSSFLTDMQKRLPKSEELSYIPR